MKYTIEERLDIGRRVCNHELTIRSAAEFYHSSVSAVVNYVRLYRTSIGETSKSKSIPAFSKEDYWGVSKDQLIQQLMLKDIEVARAKKGYEVKGDGIKKEYVSLSKKNTK
jgi:transposase